MFDIVRINTHDLAAKYAVTRCSIAACISYDSTYLYICENCGCENTKGNSTVSRGLFSRL